MPIYEQSKTLYKQTSSGSLRMWRADLVSIDGQGFELTFSDGQVGGKVKTSKPKFISAGKAGRTPLEQAELEFNSKVNKKIDEGYKETEQEALADVLIRPMLAVDFKKQSHRMQFPAVVQRKFDGVRCIAYLSPDGEVVLESRRGKPFPHLNHLREAIKPHLLDNEILDGELYSDTLDFQKVVGLVRRESISPQDLDDMQEVSYRIYDMFSKDEGITNMPFAGRYKRVTDRINAIGSPLAIVESYTVENADDVREYHDKFVGQGYEGVMVRNPRKPYEMDKRSSGLMKFKDFKDDEYKIVGYTEATGNDAGTVIWTCVAPNGLKFNVRPKGTREERTEAFNNADSYIGKMLTVRYFELTNDGVPRFPVGIAIRDYE